MNVDAWLRAVAEDDARVQVPQDVDAAVMAAWDAGAVEFRARGHRPRRRIAALALGTAGAGMLLAAAAFVAWPRHTVSPDAAPRNLVSGTTPEPVAAAPAPNVADVPARRDGRIPIRRRPRPASNAGHAADATYVLVPEVEAMAPLTMMRVRMPRSAFSRLGVPISNPDGEGMVDVEVLVGEDGVARSIRRATAVARIDENP